MTRTTEERVAGLEAKMDNVEGDIKEIKGETRALHGRINDLIENHLVHVKTNILSDKRFWAAVLGTGGVFTILLQLAIRLWFPA